MMQQSTIQQALHHCLKSFQDVCLCLLIITVIKISAINRVNRLKLWLSNHVSVSWFNGKMAIFMSFGRALSTCKRNILRRKCCFLVHLILWSVATYARSNQHWWTASIMRLKDNDFLRFGMFSFIREHLSPLQRRCRHTQITRWGCGQL